MAEARANLKRLLDAVSGTHERVIITRHGQQDAVLMSVQDLESLEETLDILSDSETVAAIDEGLRSNELVPLGEVTEELRAAGRLR